MKLQNWKSLINWQYQKLKKHQTNGQVNNYHISDLVQTFSYVENGGLNLVL